MTRVIAVDWSGKAKGAAESIWRAVVVDGHLVELENGLERTEVTQWIVDYAQEHPHTVVGFDFAFSFPAWFCEREGWGSGREVWAAMQLDGDDLLRACEPPFWGKQGKRNCNPPDRAYRQTERNIDHGTPKSVFQMNGAGSVGTGSLRGMPHLIDLADHGFSIWPFDLARWPMVIEIYPRALTGAVTKKRAVDRSDYLAEHFPDQTKLLLERAAGSEDAFDAAVSALMMARNVDDLENLPAFAPGSPQLIEGCIWVPRNKL
jgi:Protein of unknown function (DUF429)